MNASVSVDATPPVQSSRALGLTASPLKGRTAHRRSRKTIRTVAHAIEEAKERSLERIDGNHQCKDTPQNHSRKGGAGIHPSELSNTSTKKGSISSSGRRHKRRKASRRGVQSLPDEYRDYEFLAAPFSGTSELKSCSDTSKSISSNNAEELNEKAKVSRAGGAYPGGSPEEETIASFFASETALTTSTHHTSATSAAPTDAGAPTGTLEIGGKAPEDGWKAQGHSSGEASSDYIGEASSVSPRESSSESSKSRGELTQSPGGALSKFRGKARPQLRGKAHDASCLSSTLSNSPQTNGGRQSPSPQPLSSHRFLASSYGKNTQLQKRQSQGFNLDLIVKSGSVGSGILNQNLAEPAPAVALGGRGRSWDPTAVQDIGNYRMLMDDLSYLCSAIIHCRTKPAHPGHTAEIFTHTPTTAGAACDIAELMSHSGTRSTLLVVSSKSSKTNPGQGGPRVGAFEAVLESIACAPQVLHMSSTCKQLIDGGFYLDGEMHIKQIKAVRSSINGREGNPETEHIFDRRKKPRCKKLAHRNAPPKPKVMQCAEDVGEYDITSSKALAVVSYFVGIDCTGSDRAAILSNSPSNRLAVQSARKCVLRHKSAIRGIARLIADDKVVHAYLNMAKDFFNANEVSVDNKLGADRATLSSQLQPKDCLASVTDIESDSSKCHDPTKRGRLGRNRKKRKQPQQQDSLVAEENMHSNQAQQSHDLYNGKCADNLINLDFSTPNERSLFSGSGDSGNKTVLNIGNKNEEKIALALSRAKLTFPKTPCYSPPQWDIPLDCFFCQNANIISHEHCGSMSSSSLALLAADFIITGRDKFSEDSKAAVEHEDGSDMFFENDMNIQNLHPVDSGNPIMYANEMLRLSGALPLFSLSMSETLLAFLLSYISIDAKGDVHGMKCPQCISYLQKRAASLSEVIDSLCCLSPNVSKTLCFRESLLVPSLLRTLAELSFTQEDSQSSFSYELTSTALKTLTSLTHENEVACDQIISPYVWKIPLPTVPQDSNTQSETTGLDIIFSYLFKTVSMKQAFSENQKSNYDNIVFCLNILTNIIEMVPTPAKNMFEEIVIYKGSKIHGLSWLAQWVVSKTSGFQKSVMRGTFGVTNEAGLNTDRDELKAGEEGNLVLSGNGFILLACLMINDEVPSSSSIRDAILKELPTDRDGNGGGIQFMVKTLKAFCNFYHYSVGDLSVAVIAPVVKLIKGLQEIARMDQQDGNDLIDDISSVS